MVLKRAKQKGISFGYCDTNTGQRVYPPKPASEMTDILPQQRPPQQPAFHPSSADDDDVHARIACQPPLAQATTISRHQHGVKFTVLLETTSSSPISEYGPEVVLWHSHGGHSDWAELPLKRTEAFNDVLLVGRPSDRSVSRTWFQAELPGLPKHAQVVNFTIKFRVATSKGWRWVKESAGTEDGELHYQSQDFAKHSSFDLKHFFEGLSGDINVSSERADTSDTLLYSLTAPVSAAKGQDSGYSHHQLGSPTQHSRWFSLVRLWSPWLAPRQGKTPLSLDKDGVLVSFLRTDGMHVVCLAISGVEDVVTTFFNDEHGNLILKGRNDREEIGTSRVLVAVAESFDVANCAVMYAARKTVTALASPASVTAQDEIGKLMDDKVRPEWLEEWYDGLTYCTWNGLGQNLTADKIHTALDDLDKEGINITNLIIDDNWQSLSQGETQFQRAWTDFEANKDGFPNGLKTLTTEIREKHPNVNHIAVWHAMLGYWGGVSPTGSISENYKTIQVEKEPGVAGGTFTIVDPSDAQRMYSDFYAFLNASGIDSAKTDAQFFLDMLLHAPDRRAAITEYQDAWTLAHLRHFSSRAISSMSQSPQLLFHSQLPSNKPRLLVRNSDDFFPEIPASHPWHIFCNAHNALLTQHLNVVPDWDMFQTSHPWAAFHGAARALSGGPIYFTDEPGKHSLKLLNQMTAKTTRGKSVILRPQCSGRAQDMYNAYEARTMLRITTYHGFARTGTAWMGCFNVSPAPLSEFVPLSSLPGTSEGGYIVSSFRSGELSAPMTAEREEAMVHVSLEPHEWEVLTAFPVSTFTLSATPWRKETSIQTAVMGLLGKFTGAAGVTGRDIYVETNGRLRFWVQLKALGFLGIYISDMSKRSIEEDFMVVIYGEPVPVGCVKVSETIGDGNVLEVDVERAWKEMGQEPGWSNEVSLEVFMK